MYRPITIDRFWKKVNKTDTCWLWTAAKRGGYGRFHDGIRCEDAHRFSYKLNVGVIENSLYVLHKCDIRNCVNPEHLFLGTAYDNLHDAIQKGKKPAPIVHKEKTHCPHGHPYSPENTNYHKRWGRHCLICWKENHK